MGEDTFLIANRNNVLATLDIMSSNVHGQRWQDLAVIGIRRRGVPLATLLADRLEMLQGERTPVGELDLKRYTDDLEILHQQPHLGESELPFDPSEHSILVVDDVLYSGRTLLTAVQHLDELGARAIHVAVLCERGPLQVPIRADIVGMRLDVSQDSAIEVCLPPFEDEIAVRLRRVG